MKINPLVKFGNVPVQTGTIAACYDYLLSPSEKIRALEKEGQLIRLKRGLYVVSEEVSRKPVNACLCANHIYGPSYVSQQWALRWYGLIPEQVYTMTSVTTKHSRKFENSLGRFTYEQVKPEYFAVSAGPVLREKHRRTQPDLYENGDGKDNGRKNQTGSKRAQNVLGPLYVFFVNTVRYVLFCHGLDFCSVAPRALSACREPGAF